MPDGRYRLELGEVINFVDLLRHCVSRRAVRLMRGNLFMICEEWTEVISSISRLFSVTISEQWVPSWCGILHSNVHLYMTPT
jgi:hypothetical protein